MPFIRLLCLLLALAWPAVAQDVIGDQIPEVGVISDEDAALQSRINGMLVQLEGYETVRVSVRSGVVTLTGDVLEANQIAELDAMIANLDGVAAVQNQVSETTDVTRRLNPAAERVASRFNQVYALAPLLLLALLAAGAITLLGLFIARLNGPWVTYAPNAFIADIYRQVIRLAFAVAGLVLALDIVGATALLGTILGAAGIIGLAIGFAVRDTVENFIASIMLSIRQPFAPNDLVEIEGDLGKVIRLTSRATILLSLDGNHIRIPNATVFKSRIINYSRNWERRFMFDVGVEYDSDLAAVRSLVEETVQALPFVLDAPAASAWIEDMGDAGVVMRATGWIDQHATSFVLARGSAIRHVKDAIEAAGVEIPDTTYRVRLDGLASATLAATVTESQEDQRNKAPDPQPITAPLPLPEATEEDVTPEDTQALERLVDAEREDGESPDLLKQGSTLE